MQAPSTTRVLSSPSSSSVQPPLRLRPCSWYCQVSRGQPLDRRRRPARTSSSSVKCAPSVQQPSCGPVGVDALAARAVDAGPRRGQPGQVAAEPLRLLGVARRRSRDRLVVGRRLRAGGVDELDPGAGDVQRDFGHRHQPRAASLRFAHAARRAGHRIQHRAPARRRRPPRGPTRSRRTRTRSPLRLAEFLEDGRIARGRRAAARRRRRRGAAGGRGPGRPGRARLRHQRDPRGAQRRAGPRRHPRPRPARRCRCSPARTRRG